MKRLWLALVPCWLGCTAVIGGDGAGGPLGGSGAAAGGEGSGASAAGGTDPGVAVLPGGVTLEGKPVYYRVVRLTHQQWENAARDLLKLPAAPGLSTGFSPDPPDVKFRNNERALDVTSVLRTDYQRAAEKLAEQVTSDAAALGRLGAAGDSVGLIRSLGHAAYRRPLSSEEEARYAALFAKGPMLFGSGQDFADGARLVIEAVLQSPGFLYRIELGEKGARLAAGELLTKLAFLLTDAPPSADLLAQAEAGGLSNEAQIAQVAAQLLDDAAARGVLERFHTQLFGLDRYTSILKDVSAFPDYSEELNLALRQADVRFFARIFESGQGVRDILTSRLAFVNAATAPYYGLSASGAELSEVMLDESRPGFLTRLGFLAYNATLRDPDPIHRGVDINNRVLCGKLEPPVGEIPRLPPFMPGQTNRERVVAHTEQGICVGCHGSIINPLGFAFEGFDAMGRARSTDNGKPVDTSGQYAFGDSIKPFQGARELAALLSESERAHGCYQANLAEFALARDLAGGDGALVTELLDKSLTARLSLRDSLLALIQSREFTTALGGAP
jgi:hypothetical protein